MLKGDLSRAEKRHNTCGVVVKLDAFLIDQVMCVTLKRVQYPAHGIVWSLNTGELIDHKDRDRTNDNMENTKAKMNAAQNMAKIAENAPKKLPEGMGDFFNGIVESVHKCALLGMRGMSLSTEIPDHLSDYCPHIVGDLRGGGFTVDIIGYEPTIQGVTMTLFLTW